MNKWKLKYFKTFYVEEGSKLRLWLLHIYCKYIKKCFNVGDKYRQCYQPEVCFVCSKYLKTLKLTEKDFTWKWRDPK